MGTTYHHVSEFAYRYDSLEITDIFFSTAEKLKA